MRLKYDVGLHPLQTQIIDDASFSLTLQDNLDKAYKLSILANSPTSLQAATDIVLSRPSLPYRHDKIILRWDDDITSV